MVNCKHTLSWWEGGTKKGFKVDIGKMLSSDLAGELIGRLSAL
jgi:hypothetical protein